jgi:PAS domain-containing protein
VSATPPGGAHEPDRFRLLIDSVRDYGIYMLDPRGVVTTWNAGAEALTGYAAAEMIGRPDAVLYPETDREIDGPARVLAVAAASGGAGTRGRGCARTARSSGPRRW